MMLEEDTQSYSPEDNYFFSINCWKKKGTVIYDMKWQQEKKNNFCSFLFQDLTWTTAAKT